MCKHQSYALPDADTLLIITCVVVADDTYINASTNKLDVFKSKLAGLFIPKFRYGEPVLGKYAAGVVIFGAVLT